MTDNNNIIQIIFKKSMSEKNYMKKKILTQNDCFFFCKNISFRNNLTIRSIVFLTCANVCLQRKVSFIIVS